VGVNLQASFTTPPFGFSLFFLRGAAPRADTIDSETGGTLPGIRTNDIYIGVLPFVGVQVLVLALLIAWPEVVFREATPTPLDAAAVKRELEIGAPPAQQEPDAVEMLLESLRRTR
jgi:hypothetical protein